MDHLGFRILFHFDLGFIEGVVRRSLTMFDLIGSKLALPNHFIDTLLHQGDVPLNFVQPLG